MSITNIKSLSLQGCRFEVKKGKRVYWLKLGSPTWVILLITKGLHHVNNKVDDIHNAHQPENISDLQYFIGLLCYYNKFLLGYLLSWLPL